MGVYCRLPLIKYSLMTQCLHFHTYSKSTIFILALVLGTVDVLWASFGSESGPLSVFYWQLSTSLLLSCESLEVDECLSAHVLWDLWLLCHLINTYKCNWYNNLLWLGSNFLFLTLVSILRTRALFSPPEEWGCFDGWADDSHWDDNFINWSSLASLYLSSSSDLAGHGLEFGDHLGIPGQLSFCSTWVPSLVSWIFVVLGLGYFFWRFRHAVFSPFPIKFILLFFSFYVWNSHFNDRWVLGGPLDLV